MNKFWSDLIRRIFIVFAIVAIPIIAYEIGKDPFRLGKWKSIIKLKKGAPPGTQMENPESYPEINFTELKDYRFFKGKGLPPERLKELEGKTVQLKGYVLQPLRGDVVEDFRLVGDVLTCCFGGKPLVNAIVECDLEEGKYFPYRIAPHRLIGTFHMDPVKNEQGEVVRLFRMRVFEIERRKR